ncbi:MAG: FAD-binding oxidoreductase [Gammaproteobacteria bacterium]|nr:FAD-binding oxidoreductase [Gammaproteobacteria bacterium]
MENLNTALQGWRQILGNDNVITCPEHLDKAARATFSTRQRIPAILRPGDRQQVSDSLRIASNHGISIYPISKGLNWGYGSRVPSGDGCVLLDLRRLNQIVDFSEELAYVTVEPGVTQQQLVDFLGAKQSRLMLSVTGAPPTASLIGNAVERGIGKGVYGDRFAHVCGLEVVLADGRCLNTGYGRYPGAKTAPLSRWGLGPSLDGLFSQSGLGVVTRMTLWLTPYPDFLQTFSYQAADGAALGPLVDSLRELRQRGVLRGGFTLFNDLRMFSIRQRFPWRLADGRAPLDEEQRQTMGKSLGGGRWFGEGALHSPSRAVGLAERKLVKQALAGKARKTLFMDAGRARWVKRLAPLLKRLSGQDMETMLALAYERNPQRGIPATQPTKMAYWKKQTRPSGATVDLDPDRDRCGLIWCSSALPFNGEDVVRAVAIIEDCLAGFEFDANIGFNFTSERIVEANVAIVYDRDHKGEDARAHACHDTLLERLSQAGYLPSRLGIQSMSALPEAGDDSPGILDDLKKLFDAEGILAPGRYQRLPGSEVRERL